MAHLSWYTGDANTNTWVQDFSPLVLAPPVPGGDIALWPIIGKRADATDVEGYNWVEEELTKNSISGTCSSSDAWNSTSDTSWTFSEDEVVNAGIRPGVLLVDSTDRSKREVVLVTAVGTPSGGNVDLTVTRDYGSVLGGGEAHSTTCKFEIIGYLNWQGSSVDPDAYIAKRNRTVQTNYFSILDDWTRVSAEDLVRQYHGSSPDNWGYQLEGIRQRLERTFERHIIHSPKVQMSSSQRGSMGGLLYFATTTSGDQYVTDAETFSYDVFDEGMAYLYEQGTLDGNADIVCLMPPAGVMAAARIDESVMRGEYANELVRGLRCTKLMSSITGQQIPLVPAANMPSDSFMLLNLNAVRVHFLKGLGLAVFRKDVGEGLDAFRAGRLYSVITLEFQKPADNCYFHTNISWT